MGVITAASANQFISAEFVYSKIKRQWKSFNTVNLLDEADFPAYTIDVLRNLGVGAMRETDAVLILNNGQTKLPDDYYQVHASYRCNNFGTTRTNNKILQNDGNKNEGMIFENDITCETLLRDRNCEIDCQTTDKIINRITVRQFVNEGVLTHQFANLGLMNLSPNVRPRGEQNDRSRQVHRNNEYTINDGFVFTNFIDDAVYMQYYAYPFDENGLPMILDNGKVELAVEWYIKWQIMLNFWLVDDVANIQNKWQVAEQKYTEALADARHYAKLPAFSTMINDIRNRRGINKLQAFSNNNRTY